MGGAVNNGAHPPAAGKPAQSEIALHVGLASVRALFAPDLRYEIIAVSRRGSRRFLGSGVDGLSLAVFRYVRDISKTLAPPCFGVAYFLQSGGPIPCFACWRPWPVSLSAHAAISSDLPVFLAIFALKVAIGSLAFIIIVAGLKTTVQRFTPRSDTWPSLIIPTLGLLLRAVLFGFAILGIFFRLYYPEIRPLNAFWYVASLVWGLSFIPEHVAPLSDPVQKLPPRF